MLLLLLGLSPAGDAHAFTGEGTELIVRVDDRAKRELNQPWISVQLANQTVLSAPALDSGADPDDRFPGDRLYFGRIEVGGTGSAMVYVTDGGPIGVGQAVDRQEVNLSPGRSVRVQIGAKPRSTSSKPELTTANLNQGGPVAGGGAGSPAQGGGPSPDEAEEAPPELPWMEVPYSFQSAEWSWRAWWVGSFVLLALLLAQSRLTRLGQSLSRGLTLLRRSLDRAAPRPAEPRSRRGPS